MRWMDHDEDMDAWWEGRRHKWNPRLVPGRSRRLGGLLPQLRHIVEASVLAGLRVVVPGQYTKVTGKGEGKARARK